MKLAVSGRPALGTCPIQACLKLQNFSIDFSYVKDGYLHHVVEAIVKDKIMSNTYPMWLHGMRLPIVVVTQLRIIEVCHLQTKFSAQVAHFMQKTSSHVLLLREQVKRYPACTEKPRTLMSWPSASSSETLGHIIMHYSTCACTMNSSCTLNDCPV